MSDQKETPFEKEFNTLRELGEQTFVLRGSTIIVYEMAPEEIKTASGLVISMRSDQVGPNTVQANQLKVAKVLMVGPGYWSEETNSLGGVEGGYIPLEVQPGAIVILPQYSTSILSTFPGIMKPTENKLHMVKEDSIIAYYPTQEAYELAKSRLN